jgi:phospholipase C
MSDRQRPEDARRRVSRRDLLKGGLAAIGAAGVAGVTGAGLSRSAGASIERAVALSSGTTLPSLTDIGHVVILMQENRSFDHYFGRMSGVRGFSDPNVLRNSAFGKNPPVWKQYGYEPGVGVDPTGFLEPFHLVQDPPTEDGATTNDISHEWTTQHDAWNGGAMDNFVGAHLAADGVGNFATTMGYFSRSDLAFYYALADAFTICDGYHCSVLGPTDPNRVMALSGTIDPAGTGGGPILVTQTNGRPQQYDTLTWTTMPEQLLDAGVTWKVYNDPTGLALFNPLPYFKAYNDPTTTRGQQLQQQALTPAFPADFIADVAAGTLPR